MVTRGSVKTPLEMVEIVAERLHDGSQRLASLSSCRLFSVLERGGPIIVAGFGDRKDLYAAAHKAFTRRLLDWVWDDS
jgi:hypothetical protein